MLDDHAAARALRARLRAHELAEDAARDLLQAAGAVAARRTRSAPCPARRRRRRRSRTATATSNGTATFVAARRVDELDLDLGRDVRAARGGRAAAAAEQVVAEERGEEVAETAEVEVRRREAARAQAGVAVAVVERARLGVREHLVRLGHLAEARFGVGLGRDVGMQLRARAGGTPS